MGRHTDHGGKGKHSADVQAQLKEQRRQDELRHRERMDKKIREGLEQAERDRKAFEKRYADGKIRGSILPPKG